MTPKQFDQLRETPELADIDALPRERRFQVLMSLEKFMGKSCYDLAWESIKDCKSQLGYALKCQWYAHIGDIDSVAKCLKMRINGNLNELEAYCHFDVWQAWYFAQIGKIDKAVDLLKIAIYNLENILGFSYFPKVLRHNLSSITGETFDLTTTNPELSKEHLNSTFQRLLKNREYAKLETGFPISYKRLAKATEAKDAAHFANAYLWLTEINKFGPLIMPELDLEIYRHLLILDLAGRDDYHRTYIKPSDSLTVLPNLVKKCVSKEEVFSACARLYPLGVKLLQREKKIRLYDVPKLKNGGVHIGNVKVCSISQRAKEAITADQLNSNFEKWDLLPKVDRSRANKNLRRAGLNLHELVTEDLIVKAATRVTASD